MSPDAKKRFLDGMSQTNPPLKARWDAYVDGKQRAFAAANPPVDPLLPETERAIRQALDSKYPNIVHRFGVYAVVDCDGRGDPYGDDETMDETSVHDSQGRPLNADDVLYHVVTMDHPELYGCLAVNFVGGRMIPTVYGDEGPAYGEASHLAIQKLGLPSSPIDGGETGPVHDMYLIPGLGAEFARTGQPATLANLTAFCKAKGVPGFT
jgi:hypothetical protein